MGNLRIGLIITVACAALLAPTAGAVVLKARTGHRVSVMLRPGASASQIRGLTPVRSRPGARTASGQVLLYHGGPVLHSERPYLIFWTPAGYSIPAENETVMTQYLSDVAADSGQANNVYGVLTQYADAGGPAAYLQTFNRSQVIADTQRYPAAKGGCPLATGMTACLTDAQLQREVTRLIGVGGLATGTGTPIYFVITPQNVNICLTAGACSSKNFCAYHNYFTDDHGNPILYASVPFTVWAVNPTKGCQDDGTSLYQTPDLYHGDQGYQIADNLSHELSETITDPLINAWFTSGSGSEVGDLCEAYAPVSDPRRDVSAQAYFPTLSGTAAAGDLTDQLFRSHYYYNQTEWSNAADGCLATPTT